MSNEKKQEPRAERDEKDPKAEVSLPRIIDPQLNEAVMAQERQPESGEEQDSDDQ